jgi:toluene monooxygenase system ferredoxin subunit
MAFRPLLASDDLWTGELRGFLLADRRVLLLRTDAGVFAYEDRCAHLGVPLSQGKLSGNVLTCRAHHHSYDASTGLGINPRGARLNALPVRIENGVVSVDPDPQPIEGNDG